MEKEDYVYNTAKEYVEFFCYGETFFIENSGNDTNTDRKRQFYEMWSNNTFHGEQFSVALPVVAI
ncbi:MAG: hypothetical protein II939_16490 [Bacteroidales bacterium]|nr:hypothetical protein [Bacteroidales bacterium]